MTTLSIVLPDALAKASQEAARKLGVSRAQFIRRAVAHELKNFQAEQEQRAIVKSILSMKNSESYLEESEKMMEEFDAIFPTDEDEWWTKEKS